MRSGRPLNQRQQGKQEPSVTQIHYWPARSSPPAGSHAATAQTFDVDDAAISDHAFALTVA